MVAAHKAQICTVPFTLDSIKKLLDNGEMIPIMKGGETKQILAGMR